MDRGRFVLTGPHCSNLRQSTLDLAAESGKARTWIVPHALAREQLVEDLARRSLIGPVFTWNELWEETARLSPDLAPFRISESARRCFIGKAIATARAEGALKAIASTVDRAGYRRLLNSRINQWSQSELGLDESTTELTPAESDELQIYRRYVALLDELGVVDAPRFRAWASRLWTSQDSLFSAQFAHVAILNLDPRSRHQRRVLDHLARAGESLIVTQPRSPGSEIDPAWWTERGCEIVRVEADSSKLADFAPASLECEPDLEDESLPIPPSGLKILGGPGPEGQARLIAAELKALADPGSTVILVTGWSQTTRTLVARLREFGLPTTAPPPVSLDHDPDIIALLRACALPVLGWPAAGIATLLRHGTLRPDWPDAPGSLELCEAAFTIANLGVIRGLDSLRARLRANRDESRPNLPNERALATLVSLTDTIRAATTAHSWPEHLVQLSKLAGRLGLHQDRRPHPAIEKLRLAVESLGEARSALGDGELEISWAEFVAEVGRIARDELLPVDATDMGSIPVLTIDEFQGARASTLILVNLTEGTFPSEDAIRAMESATNPEAESAYARELAQFRSVLGSADHRLILTYPTVDEKGEELLPAGFLDILLRRVHHSAPGIHRHHTRFDPVLRGRADLAFTPNDQRVLATAEALIDRDPARLARLSEINQHRSPLLGAAAAFRLIHERFRVDELGPHEGKLASHRIAHALVDRFGPDQVFSASQLESYLWCPFQFFLKYVLMLKPPDERGEFEANLATFGSRVHDLLQSVHETMRATSETGAAPLAEEIRIGISSQMKVTLTGGVANDDPVGQTLQEIELARINQTLEGYADAYESYLADQGQGAIPSQFEISFGFSDDEEAAGCLTIGSGEEQIKFGGKIDRIDLVEKSDGTRFRVIDYKTGSPPAKSDVTTHLTYIQLPLYALAVDRLGLIDQSHSGIEDVGYWDLKRKGFGRIAPKGKGQVWDEFFARVQEHLIEAMKKLRSGDFPVAPRKEECSRSCDFSTVCRIGEVRIAGKGTTGADGDGDGAEADQPHNQARD